MRSRRDRDIASVRDPDVGVGSRTSTEAWVIEPRAPGLASQLRAAWRYRYLFRYVAAQTLERGTRRTVLGWSWLVMRPLLPIVLGTLVFGNLLRAPSDGIPYFLFFLTGTASWQLFERCLMWATRSLELNRRLIAMLYFPRIILPAASMSPAWFDSLLYATLILGTALYYLAAEGRWYLGSVLGLVAAGGAVVVSVALAFGLGLWLSVLEARARDVRFGLIYFMRFWFYGTPVFYPVSAVSPQYRWLVLLNPVAPLVEMFRWGVLGVGHVSWPWLGVAVAATSVAVVSGLWFFNRAEATAVDAL